MMMGILDFLQKFLENSNKQMLFDEDTNISQTSQQRTEISIRCRTNTFESEKNMRHHEICSKHIASSYRKKFKFRSSFLCEFSISSEHFQVVQAKKTFRMSTRSGTSRQHFTANAISKLSPALVKTILQLKKNVDAGPSGAVVSKN